MSYDWEREISTNRKQAKKTLEEIKKRLPSPVEVYVLKDGKTCVFTTTEERLESLLNHIKMMGKVIKIIRNEDNTRTERGDNRSARRRRSKADH